LALPDSNAVAAIALTEQDALRQQLILDFDRCRQETLALCEGIDPELLFTLPPANFSPIGWHLGHIAFTESLWILERLAGYPNPFPKYQILFAANGLPKADRVHLPAPSALFDYLQEVRNKVLSYLATEPLADQGQLWFWLLQHESQHNETISFLIQLQQGLGRTDPNSASSDLSWSRAGLQMSLSRSEFQCKSQCDRQNPLASLGSESVSADPLSEMIRIPAGPFAQGCATLLALDNEKPCHQAETGAYWIDRYPVTCGQYSQFIAAGGYQTEAWWSPAGWEWLQQASRDCPITQPCYWPSDDPGWQHQPVCGVSFYEAEAYAQFVGKRLPVEAEWEKAACWHPGTQITQPYPWGQCDLRQVAEYCNCDRQYGGTTAVQAHPQGRSPAGCWDMLGNVWEWTQSWFDGYPGFQSYPYAGYSQVYFDRQHRVLRGGSWATRPWALRPSLRNWYHPHVRQILAGFRCVQDDDSK